MFRIVVITKMSLSEEKYYYQKQVIMTSAVPHKHKSLIIVTKPWINE